MIAGPIIVKEQMPMILVLNSPIENVFDSAVIPYMKCCTTVLSMVANNFNELLIDVVEMTD